MKNSYPAVAMAMLAVAFYAGVAIAAQINIPRVELMPNMPAPYQMRDWHEVTEGYVDYVLDNTKTGSHLPLCSWITSGSWAGMFNMASYVGAGYSTGSSEAINALALIVSGTLAGYDMSNYNGHDPVTGAANMYYCASQQMCGNNGGGCGITEFWYKMLPTIFMVQIADLYPGKGGLPNKVNAIANKLYNASVVMGGKKDPWTIPNYNHYSFNFSTMQPINNGSWVESDSAAAFAWISYMAYTESGDPNHLTAADWGMSYLSDVVPIDQNPHYEVMLQYGPITAARMNAELGRSYDLDKLLYWCSGYVTHQDTYSFRVGWGTISSTAWGSYDCDGLVGSVTDSNGYAFAMNTFQSAGATIPVVRYNSDYARAIGKWMLNLANAARLLYPSFLDAGHQYYDAWNWAISQGHDPNSYIAYEGLRRYKVENGVMDTSVSPYATGDNALRLGLYGSSSVGYLGGIVRTTNVEKILQWDCLKTDFYHDTAYPTYLYYNPYGTPQTVDVNVGSIPTDVYDTVSQEIVKINVSGIVEVNIPADSAMVLVFAPAGGQVTIDGTKKLINGVVVDYKTNTAYLNCAQVQASPQRMVADITGDCMVDIYDLSMLVQSWLLTGASLGRANINDDNSINLLDFSALAAQWLMSNVLADVQIESFDNFAANGWVDGYNTGLMMQATDPNFVHEGTGSLRVKYEAMAPTQWDVKPSHVFSPELNMAGATLSFWLWTDLVNDSKLNQVIVYDYANRLARFSVPRPTSVGWTKITTPQSAFIPDGLPLDYNRIKQMEFWFSTWDTPGNSVYIDDLWMTTGNP